MHAWCHKVFLCCKVWNCFVAYQANQLVFKLSQISINLSIFLQILYQYHNFWLAVAIIRSILIGMLNWATPSEGFSHLLQNLMLKCLHFLPTAGLLFNVEWKQLLAGALFQCLASSCVVCVYHLTPAPYWAMTNHLCVIVLFTFPCDMNYESDAK